MLRSLARFAVPLALVLVGAIGVAAAVDLGGANISMELRLPDGNGGFEPKSDVDNLEYFNKANCECSSAQFGIRFQLQNPPASLPTERVDVWTGTTCDSDQIAIRDANCVQVDSFSDIESLRSPQDRAYSVRDLIASTADTCPQRTATRTVYAMIDENQDGIGDGDYVAKLDIATDTEPPPVPDDIEVSGGEGAIEVSWDIPTTRADDIKYFQVLCAREDGSTSADDKFPRDITQRWLTANDVCGMNDGSTCPQPISGSDGGGDTADAGTGGIDGGTGSGSCPELPGGLSQLDPDDLCGSVDGTQTSMRVSGLKNGVEYHAVLVVVDPSRNPTAIDLGVIKPQPVKDFWEDYKDRGGKAQGGCGVAGGTGAGVGLAVLAVLMVAGAGVGLGRRRKRRRGGGGGGGGRRGRGGPGAGAAGAGVVLVLLMAWSGRAAAEPWWEEVDEPVQAEVGPPPVNWNFELKFGPYLPNVDSEFNLAKDETGPFEQMFGKGPFLMSQMTLERYFLHPGGELGLTASAGFLTRTTNAFQVDEMGNVITDPMTGHPVRSPGDENTFRLVPATLGVVYRWTQLDELYHVPLVPYGRLGLSYYIWWVNQPSGSVAEAPTDSCPDLSTGCHGDKALGGSLGWQATLGLAIRAERLDPDAAVSLRTQFGIQHAGFLVEATYAKVDGFGNAHKLRVGDLTWFGGINFEF